MDQPGCIICEEYVAFFQGGDFNLPLDAVVVEIPRNVGSKVYAVADGSEYLSAYICDRCLAVKITDGLVDRVEIIP